MADIYLHESGKCEAWAKQSGNELQNPVVHMYQCENEAEVVVEFPHTGLRKRACQIHAQRWVNGWMNARIVEAIEA